MNITITQVGVNELVIKLNSALRFKSMLPGFIDQIAQQAQQEVRNRTPVVSGSLQESIIYATYNELADVTTQSIYGPFIETGQRMDPRHGLVRRRAGPAMMFRNGVEAVRAQLPAMAAQFMDQVFAMFR